MKRLDETDLLHVFIARAPLTLTHVRLFRRNIINVEAKGGFRVRNGIKGQADAYALARGGAHVELETKAARGIMREAQLRWRAFCLAFGIPHLVLRALPQEDPDDTVARWIGELRATLESKAA